jgi:mannobiose 2-epimerase
VHLSIKTILRKKFTYKQSFFPAGYPAFQRDARFLTHEIVNELDQYKKETALELEIILSWWMKMTIDHQNGGFYGKIDHTNKVFSEAPKGAVLNSRILWAFSSAYNLTGEQKYLDTAGRAFRYIRDHFIDKKFGGIYWTVNFKGEPLNKKKQIYALAFAIYGLSEYYIASMDESAKEMAIELYDLIVKHSYDNNNGGFVEALTRDWNQVEDLRLSYKDANEKKSMNTHLHLLEAFTNLYRISPNEPLQKTVAELIRIFGDQIIDHNTNHLCLFFDEQWRIRSSVISYGHDIEAAWLIHDAAKLVRKNSLLEDVCRISVKLAEAATQGLDSDGGLWYEYDLKENESVKQKHSWPQAEAMVGFFDAWQITRDRHFLEKSLSSWQFVKDFIIDQKLGEWYWGVNADHSPMLAEEKVGIWKCPYHNSRACMEIIRRVQDTLSKTR